MKSAKIITAIITVFIVGPIWYYLLYKILEAINASELMWFLYWIYLPIGIIVQIISRIVSKEDE